MPQAAPPQNLLMTLIVTVLAPMFLWSTDGDITLARAAAIETVQAYRATGNLSLITVATIIAFELATLNSLCRSMNEELSDSMALRLRGNANTLDRAAERNRQALNETQRDAAEQQRAQAALAQVAAAQQRLQAIKTTPPAAQPQAAQPTAAQPPAAQPQAIRPTQQTTAWADSMTRVAAEFAAGLPNLPPYERAKELARVEALTQTASALLSGTDPREPNRR